MNIQKCCYCGEDITARSNKDGKKILGRHKMEAVEYPIYLNLFFHPDCHAEIENLYKFVEEYVRKKLK